MSGGRSSSPTSSKRSSRATPPRFRSSRYVVVQAVYYIVDYFCLCFEAAYQIKFDDDQEAHRELVTDRFTIDGTTRS